MPRRTAGPALGRLLAPLAAALLSAACATAPRARPPERIVLILVDMLRADHLSCYGGAAPTPNIDRLAREGVRFPHVVAAFHQTTMSMASIFTGRTPSLESGDPAHPLEWNGRTWCGMARFATPGDDGCIPNALGTLAESLHAAGYYAIGVASNPLTFDPGGYRQGFDDWVQVGTVVNTLGVGKAVALTRASAAVDDAVRAALDRRHGDRLFLYVHFMDVHDYRVLGMTYPEAVQAVDRAVGTLLERLRSEGLLENAVVALTSDHGERLGETHALEGLPTHMGNPSFETVLRVPLILWPRVPVEVPQIFRGQETRSLLEGLAGLETRPPDDLRPDEVLLTESLFLTYRRYPWKSMRRRADDRLYLFNLQTDPGELHDVASEEADVAREHRERVGELAKALAARKAAASELSEADRQRLRSLGYVQ